MILILHAVAVLTEAIFAGQFLSGIDGFVFFHQRTAFVVVGLCVAQIAAAAIARAPLWLIVSSLFLFLAEGLQTGTGFGRFLDVHIPLGVFIFGAVTWQAVWVFRK